MEHKPDKACLQVREYSDCASAWEPPARICIAAAAAYGDAAGTADAAVLSKLVRGLIIKKQAASYARLAQKTLLGGQCCV